MMITWMHRTITLAGHSDKSRITGNASRMNGNGTAMNMDCILFPMTFTSQTFNSMNKPTEATLIKQLMRAWSLSPADYERQLRTPKGELHVYPRNEQLHKAQLLQLAGKL